MEYCKKCKNKNFDFKQGILCGLTNAKPEYIGICNDYEYNPDAETHKSSHTVAYEKMEGQVTAGIRFANFLIDRIIIFVLAFIGGVIVVILNGGQEISTLESYLIAFVIILCYYTILESTTGQSIGKMITGTYVITENGQRPNFTNILGRSMCRFIPFEPFSFFNSTASGWHDSISNTKVVDKATYKKMIQYNEDDILDNNL